jgi:hypothetical protein
MIYSIISTGKKSGPLFGKRLNVMVNGLATGGSTEWYCHHFIKWLTLTGQVTNKLSSLIWIKIAERSP